MAESSDRTGERSCCRQRRWQVLRCSPGRKSFEKANVSSRMSCKALKPKQKRPIHVAPKETVQHADDPALRNPERQWLSGDRAIPRRGLDQFEETYPTIAEALTAAAIKLLDMPERLATFDRTGA